MTSVKESTDNNRTGAFGPFIWHATVKASKSPRHLFGGRISELFVYTGGGHKFTFRYGRVFVNKLTLDTLNAIVKDAETCT